MPGKPVGDWPGTKNGRDHRVALSDTALALVEVHLAAKSGATDAGTLLKKLVAELESSGSRRTICGEPALTTITRLGFGRDAMDRIANHKTSSVTDVYDRHGYEAEDRRIMAAVARHVMGLVEAEQTSNVVVLR